MHVLARRRRQWLIGKCCALLLPRIAVRYTLALNAPCFCRKAAANEDQPIVVLLYCFAIVVAINWRVGFVVLHTAAVRVGLDVGWACAAYD